ncbi:hypothetical protein FHU09_1439 [Serratia fonticola]|nr:hypothetical protein FHU09_1439 [Serratia fonticola]
MLFVSFFAKAALFIMYCIRSGIGHRLVVNNK